MVVLIGCAVLGLLRAGVRETCKCGFFKEMTRWTKMRTIVSLCSREGGRLVRSTLLCWEKGQKQGRRRRGGMLVEGGGRLNMSRIVSGRFTQDFMGSKNPKTSYSQKYYFFCQRAYFPELAPPPPSKLEIFQPLDRQCSVDSN